MKAADRAFYEQLPAKSIRIFRGQDLSVSIGLSWTTDRSVAGKFAGPQRFQVKLRPGVLTALVDKTDIAFVLMERQESEVTLFRVPDRFEQTDRRRA